MKFNTCDWGVDHRSLPLFDCLHLWRRPLWPRNKKHVMVRMYAYWLGIKPSDWLLSCALSSCSTLSTSSPAKSCCSCAINLVLYTVIAEIVKRVHKSKYLNMEMQTRVSALEELKATVKKGNMALNDSRVLWNDRMNRKKLHANTSTCHTTTAHHIKNSNSIRAQLTEWLEIEQWRCIKNASSHNYIVFAVDDCPFLHVYH